MTPRHVVLTAAGLAVFGLGIYLFLEVKATPATADVPRSRTETKAEPVAPARVPDPTPVRRPRDVTRVAEIGRDTASAPPAAAAEPAPRIDVDKDAIMSEANKAYDRGDFDEAQVIAIKVLNIDPGNVRMLRIVVSAACIQGDPAVAQKHYLSLPPGDRAQMRTRCDRYGVPLTD